MNVAATHFDSRVLNWYCPGCKRRHGATMKGDYVNVSGLSTNHMVVGSLQGKTGPQDLYTIPLFAQVRLPRKILCSWPCCSQSVGGENDSLPEHLVGSYTKWLRKVHLVKVRIFGAPTPAAGALGDQGANRWDADALHSRNRGHHACKRWQ